MFHRAVALSFASVALAAGTSDQFPVPLNAQIGALRIPIACKVAGIDLSLDGFYTGTIPVYAAPGQPTYITDVTAAITIPQSIASLAGAVGVSYANTKVYVDILGDGTTPTSFKALPNGLWVNGTQIISGKPTTIQVPSKGVLPPIGPVVGTTVGKDATVFLGDITANIFLYNKAGKVVIGPLAVDCPAAKYPISLGSYNVVGSPNDTVFAPAKGFRPNYPALKNLQEIGYFNVPYTCDLGQLRNLVFNLFFTGVLQGRVPAKGAFSLTNITSTLTVSQDLINAAHNIYNASTFETTISDVQLAMTNAQPASLNLLKSPLTSTYTYGTSGGLPVNIPASGALTVGPFTAGSTVGKYMTVSIGNATATLVLKDASGATTTTLPVACRPEGGLNLYGIVTGPAKKGPFGF